MKWNRSDRVESLFPRQRPSQHIGQRARKSFYTRIFVKVDQLPQHTLVRSVTVGGVKAPHPHTAKRASSLIVEREPIQERGAAGDAEEFRVQGLRLGQTPVADRDPADGVQITATDAASIGKNEGKKGA